MIALNVAVRVDRSESRVSSPEAFEELILRSGNQGPGQAIGGFEPDITVGVLLTQAQNELNSSNLDRLQTWSILAVVGLALASGVGGYVLSGVMLRPVRDIASVASEIGATNLGRRINYQGPEDEMKDLADTFDEMIGRLEQAFESQRRFVQDASHELRTPLAAIRTNIEVMEMDSDAGVDEYRELLETVKSQTQRLTRLSDDLLLLTTTGGDGLDFEAVDLNALVTEVVEQLRPVAEMRGVRLRVEAGEAVEATAHSDMLYRCVFNLTDNAIKYSGERSAVTLATRSNGTGAEVIVRDTGPGIPAADRNHIFDRFYRVDRGRSRREGGSGLGLAIVRELCEMMHGTVAVESNVPTGSVFTIRLPEAEARDEA